MIDIKENYYLLKNMKEDTTLLLEKFYNKSTEDLLEQDANLNRALEELAEARKLLGGLYMGNNDHTCITRFFQKYP